jgi:hypothetical protein
MQNSIHFKYKDNVTMTTTLIMATTLMVTIIFVNSTLLNEKNHHFITLPFPTFEISMYDDKKVCMLKKLCEKMNGKN